jgi:glutaminyl-tRNA synthetase
MRRRGYTPAALRKFCEMVGTTRSDGIVDVAMLEHAIRDDLNENAPRAMCVINPLRLILTNYPNDRVDMLRAPAHPGREDFGERELPFTRELFIDRDDFREEANKKYKRLVLGKRVRLRNAYVVEAEHVEKDAAGDVVAVHCRVVEDTLGKDPADGTRPKGVIHWVSAEYGVQAELRLYDRLFSVEVPGAGDVDFMEHLNERSLTVVQDAVIEPGLRLAEPEQGFQFEREGYFVADRHDHSAQRPVFNRTIGLRDSWQGTEG